MALTPELANEFEIFKRTVAAYLQRQQEESVAKIQQLREELTLEYQERSKLNEQHQHDRKQLEALQHQWEQARVKMGLAQAALEKQATWEQRQEEVQQEIQHLQSLLQEKEEEVGRLRALLHSESQQSSNLTLEIVDLKLELEKERNRQRGLPETTNFNLPELVPEASDPEDEVKLIQRLAFEDAITGLPSLALGQRFLQVELEKARKENSTVGLTRVDVERLDDCNEVLGKGIMDLALRQFGERLKSCLPNGDALIRGPEDEFWVISPLATRGPMGIKAFQEANQRNFSRFFELLKSPLEVAGYRLHLGFFAGSACTQGQENLATLVERARLALQAARRGAKHRLLTFQPEQEKSIRRREEQMPLLQQALHRSQFDLRFQPIFELKTGSIKGVESLLRWNHPLEGLIDAADFLESAREGGLLPDLGNWVAHQVCPISRNYRHIYWFINVSAHELIQADFVKRFTQALAAAQLSRPDFIVVDFRESDWGLNNSRLRAHLRELRQWNVRLAVDDFCFESFTFKYLEKLGVDYIKLGLPITHNLEPLFTRNLVKNAVAVADGLGARLIAEGIEIQGQLDMLLELGCHWGQGHLLCSPLSFEELEQKI